MFTDHPGTLPRKKVSATITEETIDRITASKSKNSGELIGLWIFLAKTARIQGNNQPKASVYFTAKGLNTSQFKVRVLRKELAALGLIELIQKNGKDGQIEHYVRVNYLAAADHPPQNTVSGETEPKCSRKVSLNTRGKENTKTGTVCQPEVISEKPTGKALSRAEQLKAVTKPKGVPQTEAEFKHHLAMKGLENIETERPDLFYNLEAIKWHKFNKERGRYEPIRYWEAYLNTLEEKMAKDKKIYGRRPKRLAVLRSQNAQKN